MSLSLQETILQQCGLCKNETKNKLKLTCNHKLCLECGKILQQTEMDLMIEAKFKITCPLCNKMTRSFNIHNLIVDEAVCVKLIGQVPIHENSPRKIRNTSQKNIQNNSIQHYSCQKVQDKQNNQMVYSDQKGCTENIQFQSSQSSTNPKHESKIGLQEQFQDNLSISQTLVNANNFKFSTPQKQIKSVIDNSQYKTTQPSSIIKSNKNDIFTSGQNSLINSVVLSASNSTNQKQVTCANQEYQSQMHNLNHREPVKAYSLYSSGDSKQEQCRDLAKQFIERQNLVNSQQNLRNQVISSLNQQQFIGTKVIEPEQSRCKLLSGNNFSSIVGVEAHPQTAFHFQDSASNIPFVQTSIPTQYENLITFQENSSQQNQSPIMIPQSSERSGQSNDDQLISLNYNGKVGKDEVVEQENHAGITQSNDQDEEARKRLDYYQNKLKEMQLEQFTYTTHQNHFTCLKRLLNQYQMAQPLKCDIHNDFLSLYDESNNSFTCPSCIYENASNSKKKTILPIKISSKFINRDINKSKEILKGKLKYCDTAIFNSQANQKLLKDNFETLSRKVSQTFQQLQQQLIRKETDIKNQITKLYNKELLHYQKIICEVQPLKENLTQQIKFFLPNPQLDELNNSLYNHSILKVWQTYLDQYKRQVPLYTLEDINIVEFPQLLQINTLIQNISPITNIEQNSLKDIIKRVEEAAQIKQLNHITIPDNIVIKQTVAHYLKTTTRSKGRNDFLISKSIENIHQQSISAMQDLETSPSKNKQMRSASKDIKNQRCQFLNRNESNQKYSSLQQDHKLSQLTTQNEVQQLIDQNKYQQSNMITNHTKLHKSPSFQQKSSLSIQNTNLSFQKQFSARTNQSLDNSQRNSNKQYQKQDPQARELYRQIVNKQ